MLYLFQRRIWRTVICLGQEYWVSDGLYGYLACAQTLISEGHDTLAFAQGKGVDGAHLQVHSQESLHGHPFPKSFWAVELAQVTRKDRLWVTQCFSCRHSIILLLIPYFYVAHLFLCMELGKDGWTHKKSKSLPKIWSYFHKNKQAVFV